MLKNLEPTKLVLNMASSRVAPPPLGHLPPRDTDAGPVAKTLFTTKKNAIAVPRPTYCTSETPVESFFLAGVLVCMFGILVPECTVPIDFVARRTSMFSFIQYNANSSPAADLPGIHPRLQSDLRGISPALGLETGARPWLRRADAMPAVVDSDAQPARPR